MSYLAAIEREESKTVNSTLRGVRLTAQRAHVLSWINRHPGRNTSRINWYCRTARGGHASMYSLVARLAADGLVQYGESFTGRGAGVYITPKGRMLLDARAN